VSPPPHQTRQPNRTLAPTARVYEAIRTSPQFFDEGTHVFSLSGSRITEKQAFVASTGFGHIVVRAPGLYLLEATFNFVPDPMPPEFPGYSIVAQIPGQPPLVLGSGSVSTMAAPNSTVATKTAEFHTSSPVTFRFMTQFPGSLTAGSSVSLVLI
jgi:hypothetical protein